MAATDSKEIKVREKQEVAHPAEQTRPGVYFTPTVDIFETDKEMTLLADMPGVKPDNLSIDLRDNTLTLEGGIAPLDGQKRHRSMKNIQADGFIGSFLSEVIDQAKIDAQLQDGVLRLTLPKVEKATPRKIAVRTS